MATSPAPSVSDDTHVTMSASTLSLASTAIGADVAFDKPEDLSVSSPSSTYSTAPTKAPKISLTKDHLAHLNTQFEGMDAMDILRFALIMFPGLYQSTAFGLTGLVTMDMLSKIQQSNPQLPRTEVFFLDTLYHFDETYNLIDAVKTKYPNVKLHIFKPDNTATVADFEAIYGAKLYETMPDLYDWYAKVEPLDRAYATLGVSAVLTGRRRSQGGSRGSIPVVEFDEERGIVKINPLASWDFKRVQNYIKDNGVPYNALLDRGYKSIGDWHSTSPVGEGEDERAGRWKGQNKTECGIHNRKSKYTQLVSAPSQITV
ncbi:Phosphoadenosine phosphosulfate reductase [Ceratocystis lukuohia]|uniref:Phosphoadenosine phosphosulfate reductase n=1 Tax=Ceratocystis lukuohia TaxID=2019550 RepID=A0ABR4MCQ1_9PEZI